MCTAGQRVSLTITGPGPSFFNTKIYAGQRTRRGQYPIEERRNFRPSVGGKGSLRGDGAWRGWMEASNKGPRVSKNV